MREKGRELAVSFATGALVAAAVYRLSAGRGYPLLHSLCDGFFVAAVLLLGVGGLRALRNRGAFDVAGYGISSAVRVTFPFLGNGEREDIMEYRRRKAEKRRSAGGLLLAGAVYLVLSLITLGVYYGGRG